MKPCFLVHNLNKEKWVYRAVASAMAQTIPCDILITDAHSTDNSWIEMERAVKDAPRGADHDVRLLKSPMKGDNNFTSCSEHVMWALSQTESEWFIPSTSDDYDLPDRAKVCMEAVERNDCSAICTTMYFEEENETNRQSVSGYPTETGYVSAGIGLRKLAFGSCIAAYRKSFLLKTGGFGSVTPDVYLGYLAALDRGYYVVCNPQHVHVRHEDINNLGFEGKLRGAHGDPVKLAQLNELNNFQLFELYFQCKVAQQKFYPLAHMDDQNACLQSMVDQSVAWYMRRKDLHNAKITPGIL